MAPPASTVNAGRPVRVIAALLIASTKAVLALDRMAFSFFTVAMASEFGWSTAEQGRVKAAFALGSVPPGGGTFPLLLISVPVALASVGFPKCTFLNHLVLARACFQVHLDTDPWRDCG